MSVARTMLPRRIQPLSVRVDFDGSSNEDVGPTWAPSGIQAGDTEDCEDVAIVEVDLKVGPVDYVYIDLRIITGIVVSGFKETEGERVSGGVNEFGLGKAGSIQVDLVLIRVEACDGIRPPVIDIIDEDVTAGTTVQRIIAGTAVQRITAGIASQRITAGTAVQRITARATLDRVTAGAALDTVVAGAPDEVVGIGATVDRVVARAANYGVASGASHDRIIIATSP